MGWQKTEGMRKEREGAVGQTQRWRTWNTRVLCDHDLRGPAGGLAASCLEGHFLPKGLIAASTF